MSGPDTSGEDPFRTQVATAIGFLGRMDRRNLRMLPSVLSILAHASAANGFYGRDAKRRPPEPLGAAVYRGRRVVNGACPTHSSLW